MQIKFKNFQREMRKNMPFPEVVLWQNIRRNKMGAKFRRQYSIGNYILDFYAPKIKLAIEIDGETHFKNKEAIKKDKVRDEVLFKKHKIKVIRFNNSQVVREIDVCLEIIWEEVKKTFSLTPPLKGGETPSLVLSLRGEDGQEKK